jgi:hypothetical protein
MNRRLLVSFVLGGIVAGLVVAAARPGGPAPVGGAYDVTDFGARGNGVVDDSDAIQRAIDQAARRGAMASAVYIPPGKYRVTRTLVVPSACGLTIRGGGQTYDQRVTGHWGGTTLVWDGPAGGTLLRGEGATCFTVCDLSLVGRPKPDGPGRAGILMHCALKAGWGAGHWTVRNVSGTDADVGLQFGTNEEDGVCSDSLLERVIFTRCGDGMKVVNNQGVVYVANYFGADHCQRPIHFARGGNLQVNTASITGGGEIRFGGGGPNVATSVLTNVRAEGGLTVTVGPYRRVEFNGLNLADPPGPFQVDVTAATVLITGPSLLRNIPAKGMKLRGDGTGSFASLVLRDAMVLGGPRDELFDVGEGCTLKLENCYTGWGK